MVSKPLMCVIRMLDMLQTLGWGGRMTSILYPYVLNVTGQAMGRSILDPNEPFGPKLGLIHMLWLSYYYHLGKKKTTTVQPNTLKDFKLIALSGTVMFGPKDQKMKTNLNRKLMLATLAVIAGTSITIVGIAYLMSGAIV